MELVTRDKLIMRGSLLMMWCGNVVTSRQLPTRAICRLRDDPRVIHDAIWSFWDNRKLKLVQIFPNMTWHDTLRTLCHTMDVTSWHQMSDVLWSINGYISWHGSWHIVTLGDEAGYYMDTINAGHSLSEPISLNHTRSPGVSLRDNMWRDTMWCWVWCVMWWIFPFVTSPRVSGSVTK